MGILALWLWIPLLAACAATPSAPRHDAAAHRSATPLAASEANANRTGSTAVSRDCKLTRAIDGYVVCAPVIKTATVATTNRQEQPLTVSLESVLPKSQSAASSPSHHQPGHYLVIGNFSERANAKRWTEFNAEFGTEVYSANREPRPLYRVVAGPLVAADSPAILCEIFSAVGLIGSWDLAICGEATPASACPDFDDSGLTRIAEL